MNDTIRVAVVTHAPFPKGNVSTMRFTSYLRSLAEAGCFAYVLIYCPTRMAASNIQSSGDYLGIQYQYSTDITWRKYNIFNKIKYLCKGLINSVSYLKKNSINTIILYGDNPFIVNMFYRVVCTLCHMKYLGDRSELPTVDVRKSRVRLYIYGLKQKMFDGLIVMTKELQEFYSRYYSRKSQVFLLPMTIDPHRFDGVEKQIVEKEYIAIVFGTHNRDGLHESLCSYQRYRELGGTFELKLIGNFTSMPNYSTLKSLINSMPYKEDVHILGPLANEEVPYILKNASCLLTTPNKYISGGFPTKLGEYMLSGTPIVATAAGELTDYISPGEEMFLCEPGNIEDIATSILKVEQDILYAKSLTAKARSTALKKFCADSYRDDLILFFTDKSQEFK